MYKILTECPLFSGLGAEQIEQMLFETPNCDVRDYKNGEVIARRGTVYSGLMIILAGAAEGTMVDASDSSVHIDALEAPNLIAPAFLFGGYNRMPIDVVAVGDVKILTLHRGLLFELMQENMVVMSNFIDIISDRANMWSKKIYYLSFCSLKTKVASYLIANSSAENPTCCLPDAGAVAELFDTTRGTLLSALSEFEGKKLVALEDDKVVVLDRKALEDILC